MFEMRWFVLSLMKFYEFSLDGLGLAETLKAGGEMDCKKEKEKR